MAVWVALGLSEDHALVGLVMPIFFITSLYDQEFKRDKCFRANRMLPIEAERFGRTYWTLFVIAPLAFVLLGTLLGRLLNPEGDLTLLVGVCAAVSLYHGLIFLMMVFARGRPIFITAFIFVSVILYIQLVSRWEGAPSLRAPTVALTLLLVFLSYLFSHRIATEYWNFLNPSKSQGPNSSRDLSREIDVWNWLNSNPFYTRVLGCDAHCRGIFCAQLRPQNSSTQV